MRREGERPLWRSPRGWRRALLAAFLPVDFPDSVSDDYLAYQGYDALQAFFSTITSLLASRALLQGLGVGDAGSSATHAMLLTMLRDAVSNVTTIAFTHRFGLRIKPEAKKYRFLADLFNDTAFFLKLYSPYLPLWGKAAALCAGEALRAVCGVAAGASKAALSLHFARADNLSELIAKEASQETAVVALVVALVLAHLWTNYRGVRCVRMTSLNRQRASILFDVYMESRVVWSPRQVAEDERILFWDGVIRNMREEPVLRIDFARSYAHAAGDDGSGREMAVVDGPMHTRFVRSYAPGRLGHVRILLWDGAEPRHAIFAWFMAMETAWVTEREAPYGDARPPPARGEGRPLLVDGWKPCARQQRLWTTMESQGWDVGTGAMETGPGVRLGAELTSSKNE